MIPFWRSASGFHRGFGQFRLGHGPLKGFKVMKLRQARQHVLDYVSQMAVSQTTGIPKWVTLVSGNMDQSLRFAPPIV